MKLKFKSKKDEMMFIKFGKNIKLFIKYCKYNPVVEEEQKEIQKKKRKSKKKSNK